MQSITWWEKRASSLFLLPIILRSYYMPNIRKRKLPNLINGVLEWTILILKSAQFIIFFKELHRTFKIVEQAGPILKNSGILSRKIPETLKNWSGFYWKLYKEIPPPFDTITDDDLELDWALNHSVFLDSIYALKNYQATGADHITSEDVTSLIHHVLQEDHIDSEDQISSCSSFSKFSLIFGSANVFHRISRE